MSQNNQSSRAGRRRRQWRRLLLGLVVAIPVAWLSVDFAYSLLIHDQQSRWEAAVARDADGVRLGCREFTLGTGDVAILLIHGFADSPAVYQRMAPALAAKGFTCRAMRLPHFAMPMASFRQTSAAQWRQAVRAELQSLHRLHRRVFLIAHSLGAAVALDCLAEHPGAADGAILLAPLLEVSDRSSPLLPPAAWFQVLDHALLFTDEIGLGGPGDLRDQEVSVLMKTDPFIPLSLVRELFSLVERNRRRAASFRLPLFMALAEDDRVVDNQAAERFFEGCISPCKLLSYVPEASHVLPMDRGWKSLVEEIDQFIGAIPEPTLTARR